MQAVEEAARLARLADTTVVAFTRVRLRAKARWGELLPPAEPGKRTDRQPVTSGNGSKAPDQRVSESRARKLAAVKANHPEAFEEALAGGGPEKAPTEASVIRAGKIADRAAAPVEPIPMTEGIFSVLMADPPWRYDAHRPPATTRTAGDEDVDVVGEVGSVLVVTIAPGRGRAGRRPLSRRAGVAPRRSGP